jgi:hypothetical protein
VKQLLGNKEDYRETESLATLAFRAVLRPGVAFPVSSKKSRGASVMQAMAFPVVHHMRSRLNECVCLR